jgi:phosphatidylglycerophosphate synthase
MIARSEPRDPAIIVGTGATTLAPDGGARSGGMCRLVLLPVNVVPHPQSLRGLLDAPLEPETPYVDRSNAIVLDVTDPTAVLRLAARCATVKELRAALSVRFGADETPLDLAGGFALGGAADVPAAETWLLRSLIKANEGFMSRNFERRVSLAITRWLVRTPVTPNAMTLFSVAIGLAAAPFFLSSAPALQVTGALLFLTHSILDGCDGELARLKFLESPVGAVLDFWGDNVVHAAIFSGIAIGWALSADSVWPVLIGAVAVVGTVIVASTVWRRDVLAWDVDEHASLPARLVATGVHRDFIYVILGLAAFGKAGWFIIVTAVGAPLFLGVLMWASRGRSAA